jgi:hypothetical protein
VAGPTRCWITRAGCTMYENLNLKPCTTLYDVYDWGLTLVRCTIEPPVACTTVRFRFFHAVRAVRLFRFRAESYNIRTLLWCTTQCVRSYNIVLYDRTTRTVRKSERRRRSNAYQVSKVTPPHSVHIFCAEHAICEVFGSVCTTRFRL